MLLCVFFFKQKTAYEVRISDWSSDVCSSDLWARFRTEALSGGIQKWSIERYKRLLDIPAHSAPPAGLYRVITDEGDGRTWLATPDYRRVVPRSEEHTSELQSLMRISYAVFCLKKKTKK